MKREKGFVISFHPLGSKSEPGAEYRALAYRDEAIRQTKPVRVRFGGEIVSLEQAIASGYVDTLKDMSEKVLEGEFFFLDLSIEDVGSFNGKYGEEFFYIIPAFVTVGGFIHLGPSSRHAISKEDKEVILEMLLMALSRFGVTDSRLKQSSSNETEETSVYIL